MIGKELLMDATMYVNIWEGAATMPLARRPALFEKHHSSTEDREVCSEAFECFCMPMGYVHLQIGDVFNWK